MGYLRLTCAHWWPGGADDDETWVLLAMIDVHADDDRFDGRPRDQIDRGHSRSSIDVPPS